MERIELYRKESQEKAQARCVRTRNAMLAIAGAGLLACILLCVFTTRKNEDVMLPLTIGASVLSGWIVITLLHTVYGESKATIRHMQAMEEGEREALSGRFEKTAEVYRIRHGVTVRRVRARIGERDTMLNIADALSKDLPDAFAGTVDAVHGFIVAYEVAADD